MIDLFDLWHFTQVTWTSMFYDLTPAIDHPQDKTL